jgi:hypothetical protein
MELEEWNMKVLEDLLIYRDIERDSFDFKSKYNNLKGLETHVCAMANIITGVLCLGIKDPQSKSQAAVFTKDGFPGGKENTWQNTINNYVAKVDPIPKVTQKSLHEPDNRHFYVVLKVEGSVSQRPYMVKDAGQIFVRIGSSTRPASRTTIANLFINLLERRHNILKLQSHCRLLRNELILIAETIPSVDEGYIGIIPQLDLGAFKDAIISAEWFLHDENILGEVNIDSYIGGVYTNLQELNTLTTTIDIINKGELNRSVRYQHCKLVLDRWKANHNHFKGIIKDLEGIIARCDRFLQSDS